MPVGMHWRCGVQAAASTPLTVVTSRQVDVAAQKDKVDTATWPSYCVDIVFLCIHFQMS